MSPSRRRPSTAAPLLAVALAAAACTVGGTQDARLSGSSPAPPAPSRTDPDASRLARVRGPTAAEALSHLCDVPATAPSSGPRPAGRPPASIAEVERQTAAVRGLAFLQPVPVDAVGSEELADRLQGSLDASLPVAMMRRRTIAWRTIGALPPEASIRRAIERFATGQVVGFYSPNSGRLVFSGTTQPNGLERFTLSHELTHALDDQHFHLERTDELTARCDDEASEAALGVIEGSATFFSLEYARRYLSLADVGSLLRAAFASPSIAGVPPFIVRLETWPYVAGEAFIAAREAAGGRAAVNAALRTFPATTEQVMHPERYPRDRAQPVGVRDLGAALGRSWRDIDVMEVGEAWLSILLGLRLDALIADRAAAGWDGGIYRAWRDGAQAAVVLRTVWDTRADASEFAEALRSWIDAGGSTGAVISSSAEVSAVFATNDATLARLRSLVEALGADA